jgi:manganese transport protein
MPIGRVNFAAWRARSPTRGKRKRRDPSVLGIRWPWLRTPPLSGKPSAFPKTARTLRARQHGVPLDHTSRDRDAIAHAAAMARQQNAKLYILHVEEGVTSQLYGPLSSTAEVEAGDQYLHQIVRDLESQQIPVEMVVRHARTPTKEIVRYAEELKPDLVVMGAHGHKGLKDIVFGTTINAVRHKLKVPLLIVRGMQ